MNKETIEALLSSVQSMTFVLKELLKEIDQEEIPVEKMYIPPLERAIVSFVDPIFVKNKCIQKFGFNVAEVGRSQKLVDARNVTAHMLYKYSGLTLKEVGSLLGGKDHTTVIHGLSSIEEKRKREPAYNAFINDLENEIVNEFNSELSSKVAC